MKSCKLFEFFIFFLPVFLGVPDFCFVLFWEDLGGFFSSRSVWGRVAKTNSPKISDPKNWSHCGFSGVGGFINFNHREDSLVDFLCGRKNLGIFLKENLGKAWNYLKENLGKPWVITSRKT